MLGDIEISPFPLIVYETVQDNWRSGNARFTKPPDPLFAVLQWRNVLCGTRKYMVDFLESCVLTIAQGSLGMSQQLGSDVEKQVKANKSTTPRTAL